MPTAYENTLRDALRSDADVFLDTWGETIVRRSGGPFGAETNIIAIVDQDNESEGSADGAGEQIESDKGTRVRRSIQLEVKYDVALNLADVLVIAGETWAVRRIKNRDDGMKTVYLARSEGVSTKGARVRP